MAKCCCFDSRKCDCSLYSSSPNRFDSSQYDPELKVSGWYVLYRVVVAAIFVGCVGGQMYHADVGWKWFIYMTCQGILLLTIHFVTDAFFVATRFLWESCNEDNVYHKRNDISWLYKASWVLCTCSFDLSLLITIVYWGVLHKYVLMEDLLQTPISKGFNFFLHAVNSIACFIDVFVNRRPIKFLHFYIPVVYGIGYMLFSVFYWLGGGLGVCHYPVDGNSTATAAAPPIPRVRYEDEAGQTYECSEYIYPILDWGGNPATAVATIAFGVATVPLFHLFWMGMSRIRVKIYECAIGRRTETEQDLRPPPNYERPLLMEPPSRTQHV